MLCGTKLFLKRVVLEWLMFRHLPEGSNLIVFTVQGMCRVFDDFFGGVLLVFFEECFCFGVTDFEVSRLG